MSITESFISGVLSMLPEEGINKLNQLLDDGITEEELIGLLREYKIDPLEILKEGKAVEGAL
jgi:hypothetical protein